MAVGIYESQHSIFGKSRMCLQIYNVPEIYIVKVFLILK